MNIKNIWKHHRGFWGYETDTLRKKVRTCHEAGPPKGSRIVFQPSIFRCKLLVSRRVFFFNKHDFFQQGPFFSWGIDGGIAFFSIWKFPHSNLGSSNTLPLRKRVVKVTLCSTDLISSPGLHNDGEDDFMNPLAAGKRAVFVHRLCCIPCLQKIDSLCVIGPPTYSTGIPRMDVPILNLVPLFHWVCIYSSLSYLHNFETKMHDCLSLWTTTKSKCSF